MNQMSTVERPRRREYSAEFKTSVLEQSRRPGASLAGVALAHGINPNMVHRWLREERQRLELAELQRGAAAFLPVQLPQVPVPSQVRCHVLCRPSTQAMLGKVSALRFNAQAAK
jgi:transposase-like protein